MVQQDLILLDLTCLNGGKKIFEAVFILIFTKQK